MTGLRRPLSLIVASLLASASLTVASPATSPVAGPVTGTDDVQDTFGQGVDLLRRGRNGEALRAFQRVLAMDPGHAEAYELWKSTDNEIWVQLMVEGGEFELVAKAIMGLADMGRSERRNDRDAIKAQLRVLHSDDVIERRGAIRTLAGQHGEYAVPLMVFALADQDDDDWRVIVMHALTQMGTDVVVPLVAALDTSDSFQRRNIALTLGYIGDSRAAAVLAALGADEGAGEGVRRAASEAAAKCGSSGDAAGQFLSDGDDYHHGRATVLRPSDYSDVLWSWADGGLTSQAVERSLYNDELARRAYHAALALDPSSMEARAGIARSYANELAKADAGMADSAGVDEMAVSLALCGVEAADLALQWSVASGDSSVAIALCRALGNSAGGATAGLNAALNSDDGALRGEGAVALGQIALRSCSNASGATVAGLGEVAGREVMRIVAVIDGDLQRAQGVVSALGEAGVLAHHWSTGASGLGMMRRVAGLDAILVGDTLPDLTTDQVVDAISGTDTLANASLFILTADVEGFASMYDGRSGAVAPGDLSSVMDALNADLSGDRARADALAERAAVVLRDLARNGDISAASAALAGCLTGRPDAITVPALGALGAAGGNAAELAAVAADAGRSDAVRVAAADACGAALARGGEAGNAAAALSGVASSEAALAVRVAAA
ncbi:MAG: HEAT repeat domain-containing protein, partial [Planctomycetota bacterium]|nr:HEAT repeat domain-containing protein [Planctomycetota bacterium]